MKMINWIRLYFRQNHVSFSSVAFECYKSPVSLNILHRKLYHNTIQSLCINRSTSQITHPHQSRTEPKHVPISDLLSDLNSRLDEAILARSVNDVKITFNSGVFEVLSQCYDSLSQFTNDELLDFMDSLLIMQSNDPETFRKNEAIKCIMDRLDQECLVRSSKMNLKNVLPMMEKFSSLTKRRYCAFLNEVLKHHYGKIHNKPVDILIKIVNIMNTNRYWHTAYIFGKPYKIEYYLEKNFNKLNIDQMVTLILALIQMKKSIVSFELKKKLFLYVVQNFLTMNDRHLYHFLSLFCIKESFIINMHSLTREFLHLLDTSDKEFDTLALDNVALVGMLSTKFLVHKPQFLDKLCRKFLVEGKRARRSTIDNVVYTLMFFKYHSKDEDVYSKMLQIITADPLKASYKHTKRYIRLISWFCNVGVYDYNIINEILDEEYLRKTYSKLNRFCLYPYPFVIDLSVEIECPNYKGKRLSIKLKDELRRCYHWDWVMKKINKTKTLDACGTDQYQLTDDTQQHDYKESGDLTYCQILNEMSSKLNTMFSKKITHVGYILPHMPRPNLFFCLDENGQLQDLAYLKDNHIVDHKALDSRHLWFALTVLIRNTFLRDIAEQSADAVPLGTEIAKCRQLQRLNINVIAVAQDEWKVMSEEKKIKLCSNIVRLQS